jgi:uncharacterized membrane protein
LIHLIGTIGIVAGAVSATAFVGLYHLSARWWHSEEGWHVMSFTAALAVVFDWLAVRTLLTDARPLAPGIGVTRAVIFWAIASLLLWRLWLLYRRQIRPGLKRERGKQ